MKSAELFLLFRSQSLHAGVMQKIFRSIFCLVLAFACFNVKAQAKHDTSQWEKEIRAFEASDRTNPPPQNGILFIGSSSFRKWTNLVHAFPGKPIINRGFGGSQIPDSTALADRILFPYHPRLVVMYAGDNDLAAGRSAEQVIADYREFVEKVHARLPDTVIAYLSIKPCPLRWNLRDKIVAVNTAIKGMSNDKLKFIDVYTPMLGDNGQPKPDLFLSDRLHPSDKCYTLWTGIIRPYLD
ncbi:MAG TPA: SGNH/GDSL hydrolase family protein [Verrucomicrobiae bacterium]|nr:SGNH/GDSL hydrolase family protein [Verrucomicrobiae bacterium]